MILKVGEYGIITIKSYNNMSDMILIPKNFTSIFTLSHRGNYIYTEHLQIYCDTKENIIKLLEYIDLMLLPDDLRLLKLKSL
jgi:hypothetical protein